MKGFFTERKIAPSGTLITSRFSKGRKKTLLLAAQTFPNSHCLDSAYQANLQ
jgi:hypothetical protein